MGKKYAACANACGRRAQVAGEVCSTCRRRAGMRAACAPDTKELGRRTRSDQTRAARVRLYAFQWEVEGRIAYVTRCDRGEDDVRS